MNVEEIKLMRLINQHLVYPAQKLTVVRDLCGVQAQFFKDAVHSLRIRVRDFDMSTLENGLVKNWTVRGTVHVFAESDLPLFVRCDDAKRYLSKESSGYHTWQRPDGSYVWYNDGGVCKRVWALTPERERYFMDVILGELFCGEKTREELKEVCRANGMTSVEQGCVFDSWGGSIRTLCTRRFMNYTVKEKKSFSISPPYKPMRDEPAMLEMARRYFENFAPATLHDAMYYFGATAAQVGKWLEKLPVKSVECGGRTYYYIENGKSYDTNIPECILLAGFDQLMLGYQKKESLYLKSEYLRGIFNLAGIVMPPILLRGNVVGKWQKKGGKLLFTPFERVSARDKKKIVAAAERNFDDIRNIEWAE